MGEKKKVVVDTSKLMEKLTEVEEIMDGYQLVLPSTVLEELDNHKDNYKDPIRSYKGRNGIRFIYEHYNEIIFFDSDDTIDKNDNRIIDVAIKNDAMVFTNDICMRVKAKSSGLDVLDLADDFRSGDYSGYTEVYMNNDKDNTDISEIYKDKKNNIFNLNINEYLLIKNEDGSLADKLRYTNEGFVNFNNKNLDSNAIGKIKPLDEYQSCLIDSLINNQMTMVRGKAGSGKSLLSLAYSLSMIESNKYDKLIIFANPVNSRNAARLGFYPGTRLEKVLDSFVGSMLSSKLGGTEGIYQLIERGKLEILPFSDIRGYDTRGMNAIIYIVEAQNLDIDLMKLAIQRVSDDCKLIIDGDNNSQVDMIAYEGLSNGMRRVSEIFRGQDFYGEVELRNVHRSKLAEVADGM